MRFAIIGSGSKGNALVVQNGESCVVVDCGYSVKEMRRRMRVLGLDDLRGLNGLLITHGHNDHIKGAGALAGGMGIRTFATAQTQDFCARRKALKNHVAVEAGQDFTVGSFSVTPFSTVHDAKGSCGFVLTDGHVRLGVCTDLGCVTDEVVQALSGLDALYLEFNYDEQMLRTGPYPAHLKKRILSRYGHLSNDESGFLLAKVKGPQLERVVLAHLSESNNTERLAADAAYKAVGDDVEIHVAPQSHPSPWFEVGKVAGSSETLGESPASSFSPSIGSVAVDEVTAGPVFKKAEVETAHVKTTQVRNAEFTSAKPRQPRKPVVPGQAMRAQLFGPVDPPAVLNAMRKCEKKPHSLVQKPLERKKPNEEPSKLARQDASQGEEVRPSGVELAHRIELSWQKKTDTTTSSSTKVEQVLRAEALKAEVLGVDNSAENDGENDTKIRAQPPKQTKLDSRVELTENSNLTTSASDSPLELPLGDERRTPAENEGKRRFAKKKTSRSLAVRRQLTLFSDVEMTSTKSR